jgi:hypothetical protein
MSREIRSFDYVNHPYERVRDVLKADASGVFRLATRAATSRAESVASELRVQVAGLEVAATIDIQTGSIEEVPAGPGATRTLRIPIVWKAAERPNLFPVMNAELSVYALTGTETQLDFKGHYDPPLGPLGTAIDAAVGHRIAEASVHRFVAEIARYLRSKLD